MSQITCNCGNKYDSGFKFCPECAAPNPEYAKNQSSDAPAPKPMKKRFTKVGESSLNKSTSEHMPVATKPIAAKPVTTPSPAPIQKAVAPKKSRSPFLNLARFMKNMKMKRKRLLRSRP